MTHIPLLVYIKFHLFSMKYEKDIAFDITPFEKNHTNLHIACLVLGIINPPYNNLEHKK